jgi:hypothetical protein
MKFLECKLEMIAWGFGAISNAIYFRLTLEDNIDRCAFFEELNYGWVQMESEYRMSQPGFDPYNLSGRDSYYSYVMSKK